MFLQMKYVEQNFLLLTWKLYGFGHIGKGSPPGGKCFLSFLKILYIHCMSYNDYSDYNDYNDYRDRDRDRDTDIESDLVNL